MGASQGEQINFLWHLIDMANPACTRSNCHGRGITADSWSENQSPIGSGEYWPESFYEEDICQCVFKGYLPDTAEHLRKRWYDSWCDRLEEWHTKQGKDEFGNSLSLFQMAHWGCPQCKIDELQEQRADDAQSFFYIEERKEWYKQEAKEWKEKYENEKEHTDDLETQVINRRRSSP